MRTELRSESAGSAGFDERGVSGAGPTARGFPSDVLSDFASITSWRPRRGGSGYGEFFERRLVLRRLWGWRSCPEVPTCHPALSRPFGPGLCDGLSRHRELRQRGTCTPPQATAGPTAQGAGCPSMREGWSDVP
jgi:hypothetical protein